MQKHIGSYVLSRRAKLRQQYSPHVKEAAVRALEKGENMTKVATQYQVSFSYIVSLNNTSNLCAG